MGLYIAATVFTGRIANIGIGNNWRIYWEGFYRGKTKAEIYNRGKIIVLCNRFIY